MKELYIIIFALMALLIFFCTQFIEQETNYNEYKNSATYEYQAAKQEYCERALYVTNEQFLIDN